ncbi:MAG: hypothetical protein ACD_22C00173G0005 [uncultured bacterium]|nr:MAG: hypothetical protein ACD_22C00173G0005 [uncultured bacterium]
MISGAILIFGSNIETRVTKAQKILKELGIGVPDANLLEITNAEGKKSIGIDQIRSAINFIETKPFNAKNKAIIIKKADLLTTEAQNSLLKTLEEPPKYASILLLAKTHDSVLSTIISRCQKVNVSLSVKTADSDANRVGDSTEKVTLTKLKSMSLEDKFAQAQEIAKEEKEDIIELIESWIREERENLLKPCGGKVQIAEEAASNIKLMLKVKEDLEKTNVNARLALDVTLVGLI